MEATIQYNQACVALCEAFWDKYFREDEDDEPNYYFIGGDMYAPGLVDFNEYYVLNIDQVYECLHYDISYGVWTERYETRADHGVNLVNYFKGCPIYTKEQKQEDLKRIKEIQQSLHDEIKKCSQKNNQKTS